MWLPFIPNTLPHIFPIFLSSVWLLHSWLRRRSLQTKKQMHRQTEIWCIIVRYHLPYLLKGVVSWVTGYFAEKSVIQTGCMIPTVRVPASPVTDVYSCETAADTDCFNNMNPVQTRWDGVRSLLCVCWGMNAVTLQCQRERHNRGKQKVYYADVLSPEEKKYSLVKSYFQ